MTPKLFSSFKLMKEADLIIETADIDVARDVILEAVPLRKDLLMLSVGVFVKYPRILDLADNYKGNIYSNLRQPG